MAKNKSIFKLLSHDLSKNFWWIKIYLDLLSKGLESPAYANWKTRSIYDLVSKN